MIPIQVITLFIASLTKPEKLSEAVSLKKSKVFLYLLFLALITAIPSIIQGVNVLNDFQKVSTKIPEFKIEEGVLKTKDAEKSFIYQTNSLIFTFDPNGEQSEKDVDQHAIGSVSSLALLKDRFYFKSAVNSYNFKYSELAGLKNSDYGDLMGIFSMLHGFIIGFTIFMLLVAAIIETLINTLLYTIFANLLCLLARRTMTFAANWSIALFASTLPTLFFAFLNSFGLFPPLQTQIGLIVTLFFYYYAIKSIPKNS